MNKIYVMVGIQGSGKSTLSNLLKDKFNIPILSSDVIRTNNPGLPESDVFPLLYSKIKETLENGLDCIFDATSITKGARANLFNQLLNNGLKRDEYKAYCLYFVPNAEVSKKRVEIRNKDKNERYLPLEVIDDYVKRFETPDESEGFDKIFKITVFDDLGEIVNKMD